MHEMNDSDDAASVQNGKRRRLQGSCDNCRRRKGAFIPASEMEKILLIWELVRCNSAEMPNNRCTNCITAYVECTHSRAKGAEARATEIPKTAQEHVASILSTTTVYVPSHDPTANHQILVEVARYARSLEEKLAARPHTIVSNTVSSNPGSPDDSSSSRTSEAGASTHAEEHEDATRILVPSVSKRADRFFGLSSSVQFIKAAMRHMHGNTSYVVGVQRHQFWSMQPWEKIAIEVPRQIFPEDDLLESLIKIYFEQVNPILGILHFPSFNQSVSDGLHLRDREFGAVVLMVCALASRHSDDPRVFLDEANSEHSCGWKWFRQVRPFSPTFSRGTSLHQLQLICLSAIYCSAIAIPEEGWILAGLGVRLAQCAGAHHRGGYRKMEPLTAELYRRVFWILVVADTIMSSFNGRPSITKPGDFDVDLPAACDDEFWGIPNAVQPPGKPSTGAFMPVYLQLMLIFGQIQRAVYPVNGKMRLHEEIVELDSALNRWIDIIPQHLRWDPHQQNQIFLDQSAVLYSTYYHAQILIHRPFIPAPGKESIPSMTQFPSLAICAAAARSIGHVLDVQARRGRGLLHYPSLMTALFDSAVVLLVNVWAIVGGGKSRTQDHFTRATADVQNCVRVLRRYERRWRSAGRDCDIISAMLNIGKQSLKRPREAEEPSASPNVPEVTLNLPEASTAGQRMLAVTRSVQDSDPLFSLPLLTEELGRLPVYDSFDYEPTFQPNDLHYSPQSYLEAERDLLEPELLFGADPALDSVFTQQDGIIGVENLELPPISFDIPMGDSWQDWSAYLASVDGLN
ncbi:Fungal-trans domain-containing protein [Mycena venus]|uniref:Fungal-trans domain-containing protein n=1 Tax=Mycena venus TaxID=2733690 RepID=A0A8H6XTG2_9AGAR|nr:Fungal-trans domain-containing protein [Mycena venus]